MKLSRTMKAVLKRMQNGEVITDDHYSGVHWGDFPDRKICFECNSRTLDSLQARGLITYTVQNRPGFKGRWFYRIYTLTEQGVQHD